MEGTSYVYLVATGWLEDGPNPGLRVEAVMAAEKLCDFLPPEPAAVICGTAKAHGHLADALRLDVTRYTSLVGGPERRIKERDGREYILFADGFIVEAERCTHVEDRRDGFLALVATCPADTVIITNRGSTKGILGVDHPEEPSIIRVEREGERIVQAEVLSGVVKYA